MGRADVTARNLRLQHELHEVLDVLAASSVDVVVLKGLPLTRTVYGRLDARSMVDNDLLVRSGDVALAVDSLGARGLRPRLALSVDDALGLSKELLLEREGSSPIDLHWAIADPLLHPIPEDVVWSHTKAVYAGGRSVRVLDESLSVVHLAYHYVQHGFREGRILDDVARAWELWRHRIDEVAMLALADEVGLRPQLACALEMAVRSQRLPAGSAPRGLRSRRACLLVRLFSASRRSRRNDYLGMLIVATFARPDRALRWLVRAAFPPLPLMAAIYGKPVSRRLRLRYLTRPFRPLGRKIGRV